MDLTSPAPFWLLRNGLGDSPPALRRNARCEVAVIGAGITGALVADAMLAAGRDVLVLDRRQPGEGSTAASTAILQYEIDTHLVDLRERVGRERADAAYRACAEGVRALQRLARALEADTGFHRRPSVYLASRAHAVPAMRREGRARRALGLDCDVLTRTELMREHGLDAPLALRSGCAAELDPWRFTQALLARGARAGLRVHGRTPVHAVVAGRDGLEVHTGRGRVHARFVVVATGYEAGAFLPRPVCALHSTYALATDPLPRADLWPQRALVWESARPYLYLRSSDDGRLLVGGEDEPFVDADRRDALLPRKAHALLKRARRWLPGRELVGAHAWAGTFGQTRDGLAYVGAHPECDARLLFALGYGGNGITFSAVAAQVLAAHVQGRGHRHADTFAFDRKVAGVRALHAKAT